VKEEARRLLLRSPACSAGRQQRGLDGRYEPPPPHEGLDGRVDPPPHEGREGLWGFTGLLEPPHVALEGRDEPPPHELLAGRYEPPPPHAAMEPWAFLPGPLRKSFSTSFLLGICEASLLAKESSGGFTSALFFFAPLFAEEAPAPLTPLAVTGEILSSIAPSTFRLEYPPIVPHGGNFAQGG